MSSIEARGPPTGSPMATQVRAAVDRWRLSRRGCVRGIAGLPVLGASPVSAARPRLRLRPVGGEGPGLSADDQPNGHSGRWRIALRRSEGPGEPPRWSGWAVHDRGLTGAEGVPAEMERAFRRWQ